MSEYNRELLTEREKEYFDCEIKAPTSASSAASITGGIALSLIAAMARAIFVPSTDYSKSDRRLMHHLRMRKYAKYKAAVLRKAKGEAEPGDQKILAKLNQKEFVLAEEVFDADAYTAKLYEEYMQAHPELYDDNK